MPYYQDATMNFLIIHRQLKNILPLHFLPLSFNFYLFNGRLGYLGPCKGPSIMGEFYKRGS